MFDSGLAMYTTKSALKKVGLEAPTLDAPWTADEFTSALEKSTSAGYSKPLDVKKNYGQTEFTPMASRRSCGPAAAISSTTTSRAPTVC